ncbi:acetolactate decarboxylase [Larkinella terrae]|uniref:Alpha-acetolactate decarboxylase n=1 Tax=Larkinella terrae TaxID=2025311 RepID=A0A7K0ELT6_9BACT|nr:acetolactate decarboxylase [Larkinella terrae]MRS62810.1 acetolactate decarboxylase [Larkinella terrae]
MPALKTARRFIRRVKRVCWSLSIFFSFGYQGCTTKETPQSADTSSSDFLYQYSIISALQAGVFDGNLTFGEVKKHGDFGVGTFNRVDGELVINLGKLYRIRSNGTVSEVADRDSTSLAFVKFFKADSSFTIQTAGLTLDQIQKKIAAALPANEIHAIRLKGTFAKMTTRAPAPAQKPYPTLNDHLARSQVIFNLTNTTGVAVGFLIPAYMEKVNVPGFHFHYLSDDLKSGGHVYDFTATQITVDIDRTKGYYVELNTNTDFGKVTL